MYEVNYEHVDSYVKHRPKDKVWTDQLLSTYGCTVCLIVIRRARKGDNLKSTVENPKHPESFRW
jgi:hypothetical protein